MLRVPIARVSLAQLSEEVERAIAKLPADVVRVRYSVGTYWSDDPAIYFRIVLTDEASREENLVDVTGRIETILFDEIQPYENWGLLPYFRYRSASEQAGLHEPEWS